MYIQNKKNNIKFAILLLIFSISFFDFIKGSSLELSDTQKDLFAQIEESKASFSIDLARQIMNKHGQKNKEKIKQYAKDLIEIVSELARKYYSEENSGLELLDTILIINEVFLPLIFEDLHYLDIYKNNSLEEVSSLLQEYKTKLKLKNIPSRYISYLIEACTSIEQLKLDKKHKFKRKIASFCILIVFTIFCIDKCT